MRIDDLVVDPGQDAHIARHHVTVAEVDEVVFGRPFWTRTRGGRFRVLGQTDAGRYLTVIVASGVYSLVTARDATDAERRAYRARRRR